jgi:hypothetical protein
MIQIVKSRYQLAHNRAIQTILYTDDLIIKAKSEDEFQIATHQPKKKLYVSMT